jgi:transcriptional regulator with XRE-family HTH domain
MNSPASRTEAKQAIQDRQRTWLQELVKETGLKVSQLAAEAGVSDTTLSRLVNNPEYRGTLSQLTINRLVEKFNVPGPDEYGAQRRPILPGFSEAERVNYGADSDGAAVQALIAGRTLDPWRLRTNAIEDVGYLPGDVVLVDPNAQPASQDVVCAQVYDWTRGRAETVWRVFDPPFLVAASKDRSLYKPVLVDNDKVMIRGVVVQMIRPHRASAAR